MPTNNSRNLKSTSTFLMTNPQMLVGDVAFSYFPDNHDSKPTTPQWDLLDDCSTVLYPVRKGIWTYDYYVDGEGHHWVILSGPGHNIDLAQCQWVPAGKANTEIALIGFFDNQIVRRLSVCQLESMVTHNYGPTYFPFGVYQCTFADGEYDVEICKDSTTGEIIAIRVVLIGDDGFDPSTEM